LVEPTARYEDVKIPLPEPIHDLQELSGVLGIPEWWPTGNRVAIAIAHDSTTNLDDPLVTHVHRELTERKFMTLRFNFPFAEAGKRSSADSPAVLERAFRAALATLGRDPTAAPAHLFLGGKGLGAKIAAQVASSRVRIEGIFFLSFPLHTQDRTEKLQAEHLYRLISPMLFVQGTRDRRCDIDTLRRALLKVGAPTTLHLAQDADQNFSMLKKASRTTDEVRAQITEAVASWVERVLDER
jgi:predicted alpha/beta-hydrolase family hydrolase